ncbi:unnamed protein product, partial [Nesidiocoris tenuis]
FVIRQMFSCEKFKEEQPRNRAVRDTEPRKYERGERWAPPCLRGKINSGSVRRLPNLGTNTTRTEQRPEGNWSCKIRPNSELLRYEISDSRNPQKLLDKILWTLTRRTPNVQTLAQNNFIRCINNERHPNSPLLDNQLEWYMTSLKSTRALRQRILLDDTVQCLHRFTLSIERTFASIYFYRAALLRNGVHLNLLWNSANLKLELKLILRFNAFLLRVARVPLLRPRPPPQTECPSSARAALLLMLAVLLPALVLSISSQLKTREAVSGSHGFWDTALNFNGTRTDDSNRLRSGKKEGSGYSSSHEYLIATVERGCLPKAGLFPRSGTLAVPCEIVGTCPGRNPPKRDCPAQSRTSGHLNHEPLTETLNRLNCEFNGIQLCAALKRSKQDQFLIGRFRSKSNESIFPFIPIYGVEGSRCDRDRLKLSFPWQKVILLAIDQRIQTNIRMSTFTTTTNGNGRWTSTQEGPRENRKEGRRLERNFDRMTPHPPPSHLPLRTLLHPLAHVNTYTYARRQTLRFNQFNLWKEKKEKKKLFHETHIALINANLNTPLDG